MQERAEFLKREVVPASKANIERLTKGGRGDFKDFNKDGVIDWHDIETQTERIRLLEDTNGDGRADRVNIFAEGFTNIVAGVAAGVLARGDAAAGKTIFIENQQIACFRCHKINGEGGDVGPDLTGLGERKGREYLIESIVQPNKQVAAGFESVLLTMKGGVELAGLVKSETDTDLVLNSPEDGIMTLKKADIQARQRGLSAMPEELVTYLNKRELRDIIEFLATTK